MIERYAVIAARIRQELADRDLVIARVERAAAAAQQSPDDQDLFFDAAALNLHDFYSGLERVFEQIASSIDRSVPDGQQWHRELLRQMTIAISQVRPAVLARETAQDLDGFLRFRHVVRNIYSFTLDPERMQRLTTRLRPAYSQVYGELETFAVWLDSQARV